jgi:hypothetical protein
MAKPPPRAEFSWRLRHKFQRPKRNFVAPPRNSPREARETEEPSLSASRYICTPHFDRAMKRMLAPVIGTALLS